MSRLPDLKQSFKGDNRDRPLDDGGIQYIYPGYSSAPMRRNARIDPSCLCEGHRRHLRSR